LADDLSGALFVAGVAEGEEEDDGQAFGIPLCELGGQLGHAHLVERCKYVARRIQAFGRLQPPAVFDQRGGPLLAEMIELGAVLAADDEDVGEACGREQRGLGAAPFQQRIGGDGHAVDHVGLLDAQRIQSGDDGATLVIWSRRNLVDREAAVRQNDKIGERTADVNAD